MINEEKLKLLRKQIHDIQESGLEQVKILCPDYCKCCENLKDKPLYIKDLDRLPMEDCPDEICRGRFVAVVNFKNQEEDLKELKKFEYVVRKHWFHWVMPVIISVFFCWTVFVPVLMLVYTFLRLKLDKIYIKEGCLYSRLGIIFIDKKAIPLEQISFVTVKADIISEWLKMGCVYIQSSAIANDIRYLYIKEPDKLVSVINNLKKIL